MYSNFISNFVKVKKNVAHIIWKLGHFISLRPVKLVWRYFLDSCLELTLMNIVELCNIMCHIISLLKEDCKTNNLPHCIRKLGKLNLIQWGLKVVYWFLPGRVTKEPPGQILKLRKIKFKSWKPCEKQLTWLENVYRIYFWQKSFFYGFIL